MSILSEIIATIHADLYPKVKEVVPKVETDIGDLEAKVEEKLDDLKDVHDTIRDIVLSSPELRQRSRDTLDCAWFERKQATGEDLDYKHSIVDLLKLLGRDSSFEARRDLWEELGGVRGEYQGTAAEIEWLSQKVMEQLA